MKLALLLPVLLAACASATVDQTPRDPVIVPVEIEVKVPVPVPCVVDMPAPPAWALDALRRDSSHLEKSQALLAELEQRRAYAESVALAVKKCQ